jgi:hypothetical protein
MNTQKPSIFISYSHKDEACKNQIRAYIEVMADYNNFKVWDDRQIETGDEWHPAIEHAINQADMAVLLISIDFLTSTFIKNKELPHILHCRNQNGLKLYPILLSACPWDRYRCNDFQFRKAQVKPTDAHPLDSFDTSQQKQILKDISEDIERILLKSQQQAKDSYEDRSCTPIFESENADDEKIGNLTYLNCNRRHHVDMFLDFFNEHRQICPKTPHAYFVYGLKEESPLSLMERLRDIEIRELFRSHQPPLIPRQLNSIEWPERSGRLKTKQNSLLRQLFQVITSNANLYQENGFKLADLYQSRQFADYRKHVMIIPHILTMDQWDQKLMNWYINDYWYHQECYETDVPQCLLFFIIECAGNKRKLLFSINERKRAEKQLKHFTNSLDKDKCPHLVFDPLNDIEERHVRLLLQNYFKLPGPRIEEIISKLFNDQKKKYMLDIESYLFHLTKEIQTKENIQEG